jgi:aldehyde dehydrogenase (NAD+)/gamma-glutamyl-gamma-aminobutyraldehyde dehydrogenase
MTEKNAGYYRQRAQSLRVPPPAAHIDGSYVLAREVMETINPATGDVLGTVAHCQPAEVDRAVVCARRAFRDGGWSRAAPEVRKQVLLRLAQLIREHSEELAILESLESGKPIRDCLREIGSEVPATFQWYAELIDKAFGKVAATGGDACALIVKEPMGVVGLVLPWNFPLLMAAWKLAPALASGCSAIVKPAEQTSMSTLRLSELAGEAGVPAGVLNVVPGSGETTGRAVGRHNDIDVVSFTGSTEVGRHFLQYSSESNLKPIGLEMGGKSPFIVLADAQIDDDLIENAITSAFWNGGQNCSANMRQIVDARVADEYVSRVVERTKRIVVGDPLDPSTELGPMISREHRERVLGYVAQGKEEGAQVALDLSGIYLDDPGWFVGATIFSSMNAQMRIAREEIFGPVLGVLAVEGFEEALAVANDSDYGLHATVYTRDLDKALLAARRLACGTVAVNGFTEGDVKTPFGGYKRSGSLARDKGTEAMDQYLQTKTVWISVRRGR